MATTSSGPYVEAKRDQPELRADVAGLLRPGSLAGPAALFDRAVLGGADVNDPDLGPSERGRALALRVLSFARPAVVAGVPSWERPERPLGEAAAGAAAKETPLLLTVADLGA